MVSKEGCLTSEFDAKRMQRKEMKHMGQNRDDEEEEYMDWEKASQHTVVCAATGTTKRDVVRAIAQGAETVADIVAATGACGDCCAENLQGILDVYLTALRAMRSGCGCGCSCGGNC